MRFACPDPALYTQWLDRDDPTGNGDGEHLGLHVQEGNTCAEPIGVECQTTDGLAWQSTGDKVSCQANKGSNCLNADQADCSCLDYHVLFICPKSGVWTPWLSGDIPDGDGDDERLLRHVGTGKSCPQPLAAECRRISDRKDWSRPARSFSAAPPKARTAATPTTAPVRTTRSASSAPPPGPPSNPSSSSKFVSLFFRVLRVYG